MALDSTQSQTPSGATAQAILSGQAPSADVGALPVDPSRAPSPALQPAANGAPQSPLAGLGTNAPANSAPPDARKQNAVVSALDALGRHAQLGKVAGRLLRGETVDYSVDPQSGQTIATPRKMRPSEVFQSIVSAALLGLAGNTNSPQAQLAEKYSPQAIDQQRRAQAQQEFQNQRAAQSDADEKTVRQAQLAHAKLESIKYSRDLDRHSPESIDAANASYRTKLQASLDAGGQVPKVMVDGQNINGQTGNLSGFYKAYQSNPAAFQPPAGYSRVEILRTDTNGLTHDEHTDPATGMVTERWLDASGNPVDMDSRTSLTFVDVPRNTADDPVATPGSEVNLLHGSNVVDPKGTYNLSLNQKLSIANEAIRNANGATNARANQTRANATRDRAAKTAGNSQNADALKSLNQERQTALAELNQAAKSFDDAGYSSAKRKLDGIDAQLQKLRQNSGGPPKGFVRFRDSQGGVHDIPSANLSAARKRDPRLTVIQ